MQFWMLIDTRIIQLKSNIKKASDFLPNTVLSSSYLPPAKVFCPQSKTLDRMKDECVLGVVHKWSHQSDGVRCQMMTIELIIWGVGGKTNDDNVVDLDGGWVGGHI